MATTTTTLATLRARALAAGYVLTLDCDLRARPLDCTDTDCPLHGTSESAHAVRVAYNRGDAFAVRDMLRAVEAGAVAEARLERLLAQAPASSSPADP